MHNRQGGMAFTLRTMVHVRGKDSVSTMMLFESFELAVGNACRNIVAERRADKGTAKTEIKHGEAREHCKH